MARKRASSSSSEAALPDVESAENAATPQTTSERLQPCFQVAKAPGRAVEQAGSSSTTSTRIQLGSLQHNRAGKQHTGTQQPSIHPALKLDGLAETGIPHSPSVIRCGLLLTESPQLVVEDSSSAVAKTPTQLQAKPQLLSSARARRRNGRSHTEHVAIDVTFDEIEAELPGHETTSTQVVPDLVLTLDNELESVNPALDAGAPVFIPRTRFGTATTSSTEHGIGLEPRWSSVDSTHSSLNLRIRSSSERNSDFRFSSRHVTQGASGSSTDDTYLHHEVENVHRRHRRRSRTTDQNTGIRNISANLDRYPLLRPPTIPDQRPSSRLGARNITPAHSVRLVSPSALHVRVMTGMSQSEHRTDPASAANTLAGDSTYLRTQSSAMLANSRSTPNLPHQFISPGRIYSRGSSLSWSRSSSRLGDSSRVPSMVSAASGISGDPRVSRQSSREGLDAAAEFLRMRNSPLDDLTERLSRLSSSRPRSVGRSWERPPRNQPRVSLLTGDPFPPAQITMRPDPPVSTEGRTEAETIVEDLVGLSLALPPSSSLPSTPPASLSTPPTKHKAEKVATKCPAHNDEAHGYTSPPSCIKRKPVPTTTKTPKVTVYDDSKPSHTQPQTPADVLGSTRRAKARSETAVQQSPTATRHVKIAMPPVIPERHPHRYTYPPGCDSRWCGHIKRCSGVASICAVDNAQEKASSTYRRA